MATNNAINLSAPGVTYYNGAGTFSGVTGVTDLVLTSTGVSTPPIYKAGADLHVAKFIVGSGPSANFTTIASAYAAAVTAGGNQTVFIQDGTYTENITLTPGVNITAFGSSSSQDGSGNVIISGTLTMTAAGSCTIYGVQLQTNSAFAVVVSGTNDCRVNLTNCYINASNNTAISLTNSNASSFISLQDCNGDIGTTGITFYVSSGLGIIYILSSYITNSGLSTTPSSNSSGTIVINHCLIEFPMSTTGTGSLFPLSCNIGTSNTNTTIFNIGGADAVIDFCNLTSGTGSICNVSTSVLFLNSILGSNTANIITGSGSVTYANCSITGSGTNVSASTVQGYAAYGIVGSSPAGGALGEQIRSYIPIGSAVSLTSGTGANITSISLTPGVWDISSNVGFVVAAATLATVLQSSISTTSGTITSNFNDDMAQYSVTTGIAGLSVSLAVPAYRQTVSTTTTYFLVALANFTVSTISAIGRISATRVG